MRKRSGRAELPLKIPAAGQKRRDQKAPLVEGPAAAAVPLTMDETVRYAQMVIDENQFSNMEQLAFADPEICKLVRQGGLQDELRFAGENEIEAARTEPLTKSSSYDENGRDAAVWNAATESSMYRRICAECFGIGSGTQYVGGKRSSVQGLQSRMKHALKGADHKAFVKCWNRMVSEGAIQLDRQRNTASLIPAARVHDAELDDALRWVQTQQLAHLGVGTQLRD